MFIVLTFNSLYEKSLSLLLQTNDVLHDFVFGSFQCMADSIFYLMTPIPPVIMFTRSCSARENTAGEWGEGVTRTLMHSPSHLCSWLRK